MHRIYGPATIQRRLGACVASILEIEAGQAPTFDKVVPDDLPAAVAEFVRPLGLSYVEFALDPCPDPHDWDAIARLGFCIFRGPSAREIDGEIDSVVLLGTKLAHDPGNDGSPMAEDEINSIFDGTATSGWRVGIFVPFDPLRVRRHTRPENI